MKRDLFPKPEYRIEPEEPLETVEEVLKEVKSYFTKQNKEITVVKADKVSVIEIDGKQYVVRTDKFVGLIGGGRPIDEPYPVNYYGGQLGNVGGFKLIHLYPYDCK